MFIKLIVEKLTANSKNKRQSLGYLSGIAGIIINIALFITKFAIGSLLNSVSILADAFNNLSDLGSSLVTIIGFKISDKPADKNHPYGHGRGEYIAGLFVSFMVVLVGFEFVKSSFDRILHPTLIKFEIIPFIVLLVSISFKAWLGYFNDYLAREASSGTLNATSFDSFADCITTATVALSLLLSKFTTFPLDGFVGLAVALFILYSGYKLVKDTISPLIGEAPEPELVESIIDSVMSYENIIGVHDLLVHSYGTGKYIASIHAELPHDIPLTLAHEIVDNAENEISKQLNINLIIHIDPVESDNDKTNNMELEIKEIVVNFPAVEVIKNLKVIEANKTIIFDAIFSKGISNFEIPIIIKKLEGNVKSKYPDYKLFIKYNEHID